MCKFRTVKPIVVLLYPSMFFAILYHHNSEDFLIHVRERVTFERVKSESERHLSGEWGSYVVPL